MSDIDENCHWIKMNPYHDWGMFSTKYIFDNKSVWQMGEYKRNAQLVYNKHISGP